MIVGGGVGTYVMPGVGTGIGLGIGGTITEFFKRITNKRA